MPFRSGVHRARFADLLAGCAHPVVEGAQLLAEMLAGDSSLRLETAQRLRQVDHDAEAAALALLSGLSAAFVTPVDRVDLYRVGWAVRTVVSRMDAVADELVLFEIGEVPSELPDLVQVVIRASDVTALAVPNLARPSVLMDPWLELIRLGKQAGQTQRQLVAQLTSTGAPSDPATLVRLAALAQSVRRVVEAFEDVADALQVVCVREG